MIETICPICRQRYPLGQDHACPNKSRAKATKASPRDDAQMASEADGVASRLSAGRTAQGAPVKAVSAALTKRGTPRKRAPKGSFDRKTYHRELMRKTRAKAAKETK